MPLVDRQLREVWDALRAQQAQRSNVLRAVLIRRLRGIRDLRVPFNYPVCVLAGPNGCGKSTVLFSCASAYRDPARGPREFVPTSLFPNFIDPGGRSVSDAIDATELEFDYVHEGAAYAMVWRRGKSWNRSFLGRKGGRQPERSVYLRTLANLTNPSEVRGLLQLARKRFETREISADLLVFAHRILPREYRRLSLIRSGLRDLLFVEVADGSKSGYSEFHMSSGERAVLRISQDISSLDRALVLIDEVRLVFTRTLSSRPCSSCNGLLCAGSCRSLSRRIAWSCSTRCRRRRASFSTVIRRRLRSCSRLPTATSSRRRSTGSRGIGCRFCARTKRPKRSSEASSTC